MSAPCVETSGPPVTAAGEDEATDLVAVHRGLLRRPRTSDQRSQVEVGRATSSGGASSCRATYPHEPARVRRAGVLAAAREPRRRRGAVVVASAAPRRPAAWSAARGGRSTGASRSAEGTTRRWSWSCRPRCVDGSTVVVRTRPGPVVGPVQARRSGPRWPRSCSRARSRRGSVRPAPDLSAGTVVICLGLGVAHPHHRGAVARVADEPGVLVVVGRARLAGRRLADCGAGAGAARR